VLSRLTAAAVSAIAALAAGASAAGAAGAPALTPLPARLELRPGEFVLHDGAVVVAPAGDAGAAAAVDRLKELMARTRGFGLRVEAGGAVRPGRIAFVRRAEATGGPEAYDLEIGPDGAVVSASGDAGLFYGAETLWQLLTEQSGRAGAITVSDLHIQDAPRFAWRGLMLDSARHFQSPAFVERLIDQMALHKLNVLHWHLTDDQGWRLEIRKYPGLTDVGAWRRPAGAAGREAAPYGGFYTQEQVREIVAYAQARHIDIVPEIEMPGHATAAIAAYPAWGSDPHSPKEPPEAYGVLPNLYNPEEATISALQDVLAEVMALFPGRFIHVGGDEAVKAQWRASPQVQARMRALGVHNEQEMQAWFIGRMDVFLTANGRRLVGWDEILEGGLAPGATVMSWRGADGALAAARAGHDTVLSPAPTLYLDNRQGDGPDEPPGRGYVLDLKQVYGFDPIPASLSPAEQAHVLGLQANLWTELVRTEARADEMAFPRAAAVAEIGWSPAQGRDFAGFARREAVQIERDRALDFDDSWSAYAPRVQAEAAGEGRVRIALRNQSGFGQIRYTLDGSEPRPASPAFEAPFETAGPARLRARVFDGARPIAPGLDERIDGEFLRTRVSQQLTTCAPKVVLDLEDDAPLHGPRAVFLIDILNPCWIWPKADLDGVAAISAAVGQVPFNFAFATDNTIFQAGALAPKLKPPATPDGELEVRLDGCEGEPVAVLPLAPAVSNPAVTTLPAAALGRVSGRHDLCFTFTGRSPDPLWALAKVRLLTSAPDAGGGPARRLQRLFERGG
jgi:hexosaminidase